MPAYDTHPLVDLEGRARGVGGGGAGVVDDVGELCVELVGDLIRLLGVTGHGQRKVQTAGNIGG